MYPKLHFVFGYNYLLTKTKYMYFYVLMVVICNVKLEIYINTYSEHDICYSSPNISISQNWKNTRTICTLLVYTTFVVLWVDPS